jgi:hypothetical protein
MTPVAIVGARRAEPALFAGLAGDPDVLPSRRS